MSLYLVRHGQTVWNRDQRLQGRLDSPLTLRGVGLALAYGRLLSERLTRDGVAADELEIHASPLSRAHQTAALIADHLGTPASEIRLDELLAEHDMGNLSGRTWEQIGREDGTPRDVLKDWSFVPPGGESRLQMLDRARRWLALPRAAPTTIVVSHGGFSRALRGAWLDLDLPRILALSPHDHGRLYRLRDDGVEEVVLQDVDVPAEDLLS